MSSLRPGLCCPSMVSTGLRANYVRLLRSCCWFRIGGFWALRSSCAKSPCLRQALRIKITPLPRLRHFRCIREIIEDSSDLSPQLRLPIGEPGLSVSTMFLSQPMYRPARFFCLSRQIGQLGCRLARTSCPRHRSHLHLCSNLVGARVRTLPIDSSASCLFRAILPLRDFCFVPTCSPPMASPIH